MCAPRIQFHKQGWRWPEAGSQSAGPAPDGRQLSTIERFTTRVVPPQRRRLFWREIVAETFPGMTASVPEGIRADLARWSLGRIGLARARSDRARVNRVALSGHQRSMVLHFQRRGSLSFMHGDHVANATAGDMVIVDDSQAYAIEISERNDCLILQVPTTMLEAELAESDWHGRLLRAGNPNVALLRHLLENLWREREMFEHIDEGFDGVVAAAICVTCRRDWRTGEREAQDSSPISYALRHLADPALNTSKIATAPRPTRG